MMISKVYQLKLSAYLQIRKTYIWFKRLGIQVKFFLFKLFTDLGLNPSIKDKSLLSGVRGCYPLTKDWFYEKKYANPNFPAEFMLLEPDQEIEIDQTPKAVSYHRSALFEARAKKYRICELFVTKITNGRVWGRNGAVITPDNYVLEDLSIDHKRKASSVGYLKHAALIDWAVSSVKQVPGRVAVLTHPTSFIYFHWMLEVLPRLELLRKANFNLDDFDAFIFSSATKSFQKQSLAMLGIPEEKIIECTPDMVIQAEEMVVPSQLVGRLKGTGYRPWALDFVNNLIGAHGDTDQKKNHRRIYIGRGNTKFRKVLNEAALIDMLEAYGFVSVNLEDYSLTEQRSLMASAEAIVAPHGSGLTNLVFCRPDTLVIELFPTELLAPEYPRLSLVKGLDYYYAFSAGQIKDDWNTAKKRAADILVDLKIVEDTLQLAGLTPVYGTSRSQADSSRPMAAGYQQAAR